MNILKDNHLMDPTEVDFNIMTEERAPITGPIDGNESHAFDISIGINPLIAAAAPLLTLARHLRRQKTAPDTDSFHHSLQHEIKAFENKAHEQGYRSQMILGARYLLCAFIDEVIANNSWGKHTDWLQFGMLNTFQREQWGGQRFFIILERCAEDASIYIDLLELGYLCLSLGYQGKYHDPEKRHDLGVFIDTLYDVILQQRGESDRQLLINNVQDPQKNVSRWSWPPVWATLASGLVLVSCIFIPYYQKLTKLTAPINKTIVAIKQDKSVDI